MQQFHSPNGHLHGDWSQAAVLLCAGALGQDVTVTGISTDTVQGDVAVLKHLEALGARIEQTDAGIRAVRGEMHGAVLDMRDCPDIAPILALVCQLIPGDSRLTGCGRLRLKECDRLAAACELLNDLGGSCEVQGNDLIVHGVERLRGGSVKPYHDHRMVMLASMAALCSDAPVSISDPEALEKSWPDYLNVYRALGGKTV